jgi:outer membrane protein assembly factor BamE (lipoprotein component of BamABCDE complex)
MGICMFKNLSLLIIIVAISSCALKKIDYAHGVLNLNAKEKLLETKKTNKNDTIKLLGESLAYDFTNKNIWIYSEVRETRSFYGKKIIVKNDVLVLEFDQKGVLIKKNLLNLNQMNEIVFDDSGTKTMSINQSVLKQILSSTKKRMDAAKDKYKN